MPRTLASGFAFPEAPCGTADGRLAFSDVQGGVFALGSDGAVSSLVPGRRGVGGIVAHADGGVVFTGRDLRLLSPDGTQRLILAAPEGFAGFNDAGATPDGDVLVGALAWNPIGGEQPMPSPVLRVGAGGEVVAEWTGTVWPNGIQVLPDAESFVVNDFQDGRVLRGRLSDPGELEPYASVPSGSADGLAVASDGSVFVALGPAGAIARLAPDGTWDEPLDMPAGFVTSMCFTGPDRSTLVVTAAGSDEDGSGVLLSVDVDVPGLELPPARC